MIGEVVVVRPGMNHENVGEGDLAVEILLTVCNVADIMAILHTCFDARRPSVRRRVMECGPLEGTCLMPDVEGFQFPPPSPKLPDEP